MIFDFDYVRKLLRTGKLFYKELSCLCLFELPSQILFSSAVTKQDNLEKKKKK